MTRRLLHTFFLLASIAIFTASTHAQQTLGTLLGTVTDPSQAVIPGVAITLTNNDTGLTRTIKTRGNGEYTFNDLPIGTYTLTFTLPDFQVEKHPDVLIQANRTTTPKEIVDDIVNGLPLSRMGTPEDLVGMCLFLLSDEASWITGQIFNVDGGQVIRS